MLNIADFYFVFSYYTITITYFFYYQKKPKNMQSNVSCQAGVSQNDLYSSLIFNNCIQKVPYYLTIFTVVIDFVIFISRVQLQVTKLFFNKVLINFCFHICNFCYSNQNWSYVYFSWKRYVNNFAISNINILTYILLKILKQLTFCIKQKMK